MSLFKRNKEKTEEGRIEGRIEEIVMLIRAHMSSSYIEELGYTEEEIKKAEKALLATIN